MSRSSLNFLVQKFYLPLGAMVVLLIFSLVLLFYAKEKEKKLSVLVQEVEHVQLNLLDAAISLEKNTLQAVPAKVVQISSSLSRIEADMQPQMINSRVATEWQAVQQSWNQLKSGLFNQPLTSDLSKPQKSQLGLGLVALQIRCNELILELNAGLERGNTVAGIALVCSISLAVSLLAYICFFMQKYMLQPLAQMVQQLSETKKEDVAAGAAVSHAFFLPLQEKLRQQHEVQIYLAQAAGQVGDGNFQQDEEALRQAGVLGGAVLLLRQKMQAYFQAEQRREWSSQGIERFGKLLREQNQGLESLSKELVSELVPFMNASQGAVFVAEHEEEGEEVLQLKASYAWGRHKFLNKSIRYGEGLIGQVAQEKELMLITDVPADYITIGSGLGRAKPRCILILPLITNDVFQGAIELASFRVFEAHELEFLQKLAENVASSLANLKAVTKTNDLLQKANAANAHLQAQEEELRQNTEELIATQEAMQKKDMELTGLFASIDYSLFTAEFSLEGLLMAANDKFKSFLNIQLREHGQYNCFQLLQVPGWAEAEKKQFMQELLAGQPQNTECKLVSRASAWITASFTPVLNAAGSVQKIMMLASDISSRKEAELAYIAQTEEITLQEEKLRLYTTELEKLQASLSDKLKEAQLEMEQQIQEIALEKEKNVAILEGCVDGVVSFNEKGVIEYFNRAAEEIWETSRLDVLGSNIRKLMCIEIKKEGEGPQVYFSKGSSLKALDVRTEVPLFGAQGEEIEALLTLTRVKVGKSYVFTAFVQKVAVELF